MSSSVSALLLMGGWAAWSASFVFSKGAPAAPLKRDRRARWGILLQAVGYSLLWQNRFWERPVMLWRAGVSVLFLILASVFSWTAVRALGRHWRIDAALGADHELVRTGPYRLVRHPIYTSMLYMLLATGLMLTPLPMLLVALAVFIAGTEIRVRVEDALLASHFGQQFRTYQRSVPAFFPFLNFALEKKS